MQYNISWGICKYKTLIEEDSKIKISSVKKKLCEILKLNL
jgi:hypothetical protein